MNVSVVAHCPVCGAVVNVTWKACPSCSTPTTGAGKPGASITWLGADGRQRGPAVVDSVHTADDGSRWAFVSLPDGLWAAVNTKHARLMAGESNNGRAN